MAKKREPEPKQDKPRRRVQIDFSERGFRELLELRGETDAQTNSELVRKALKAFRRIVSEEKAGGRILAESASGDLRELVLL